MLKNFVVAIFLYLIILVFYAYLHYRDLCINRNNHQKPTFHPLGDFLNPALALLGQGLKKSPIGQKLDFASHSYLCKGLYKVFNNNYYPLDNIAT
ncbi:hypothetical protein BSPWISOXPB_7147 [uncultured Gammaproteobacteria bacterium]|nr:hypothetical protein BSPWISOXPB_7147 [uncultured Gammaproteobacteria bacterium]